MGQPPTPPAPSGAVNAPINTSSDPMKSFVDAAKNLMKAWDKGAEQLLDSMSFPADGTADEDYKAWKKNSKSVLTAWADSFKEVGELWQPADKVAPKPGPGEQKVVLSTPVLPPGVTDTVPRDTYFPPWLDYPVTLWVDPAGLCSVAPATIPATGTLQLTFTFSGPAPQGQTLEGKYGCTEPGTSQPQQILVLGDIELTIL